jgi:hypothetical protein
VRIGRAGAAGYQSPSRTTISPRIARSTSSTLSSLAADDGRPASRRRIPACGRSPKWNGRATRSVR